MFKVTLVFKVTPVDSIFFYALLLCFYQCPKLTCGWGKSGVQMAYFKNPLFHNPLSVENQGVAKYKSDTQMYKNS